MVSALSYSDSNYFGDYVKNMAGMIMDNAPDDVPEEAVLLLTALGSTMGASIGFGAWVDTGFYTESKLLFQAVGK